MSRYLGNALAALALSVGLSLALSPANAQEECDVEAGITCAGWPLVEPGDPISCTIQNTHASEAPFSITRLDANSVSATIPGGSGVPIADIGSICNVPSGEIRVTDVQMNAVCQKNGQAAGTACDPNIAGDCVFPCITCETNEAEQDDVAPGATLLTCPGLLGRGRVEFEFTTPPSSCDVPDPCEDFLPLDPVSDIRTEGTVPVTCINPAGDGDQQPATASPTDDAMCAPVGCPVVDLEKECETVTEAGECFGDITITITNDSLNPDLDLAPATLCEVTDFLDPDGANTPVPLDCVDSSNAAVDPANFDLPVGEVVTCTGTVGPLDGSTVDEASVDCLGVNGDPEPFCTYDDSSRATCSCEGDNFKCYKAKLDRRGPRFARQPVTLDDQFGVSSATVLTPFEVCNPVDKNGEGIGDPQSHLMCYKIRSQNRVRERVLDEDQFGSEELQVSSAIELCLPAIKNGDGDLSLLEQQANHFQCYRAQTARGTDPLLPGPVTLEDQFETKETELLGTSLHCNPVSKNQGPLPDPDEHLKCYDIRDATGQDPFLGQFVDVEDQFGSWDVIVGRPTRLCEPATKEVLTGCCMSSVCMNLTADSCTDMEGTVLPSECRSARCRTRPTRTPRTR